MRNSVGESALAVFLVADTPGVNMSTIHVAQHRILYFPFLMECLDDFGFVVSHANDTDTDSFELVFEVVQFHELTNAEGSPVDGAIEDE